MRIGIFGGTFDPVHLGHLLLAESCREAAQLDEVWFVPAATSPHKQDQHSAAGSQRCQMLRLAIDGHRDFTLCEYEVQRGGVSYTVDTLDWIRSEHPDAELFLLLGADSLMDLPSWREPRRICELAIPLVVARPNSPAPQLSVLAAWMTTERLDQIGRLSVSMPQIDISSRDIRRRVAAGLSIRYRTPRAVEKYIETSRLYCD